MSKVLASVGIFIDKSQKEKVVTALSELDNLEEVYEVAGEYDIMSLVSASGIEELREILRNKIMKIKGINCSVTNVILKPHSYHNCAKNTGGIS